MSDIESVLLYKFCLPYEHISRRFLQVFSKEELCANQYGQELQSHFEGYSLVLLLLN